MLRPEGHTADIKHTGLTKPHPVRPTMRYASAFGVRPVRKTLPAIARFRRRGPAGHATTAGTSPGARPVTAAQAVGALVAQQDLDLAGRVAVAVQLSA
jgi:hypothetical protein